MADIQPTNYDLVRDKKTQYLYTKGYEYSLNGKNYIGEYHISGKQAATGPTPGPQAIPLRKYYSNPDLYEYDKARKFAERIRVVPDQWVFKPTDTNYESGYITRFFVERSGLAESYPLEIDFQQAGRYGRDGGIDEGLYSLAKIKWLLVGYERSTTIKGIPIEGIYEHNLREVRKAMGIIPKLYEAIKNYTEGARFLVQS